MQVKGRKNLPTIAYRQPDEGYTRPYWNYFRGHDPFYPIKPAHRAVLDNPHNPYAESWLSP